MRNQLRFWGKRALGLLLLGAVAIGAVELSQLNIAVIWNSGTNSYQAPRGWQVGGTNTGGISNAPEIGKAQLKLLLSGIDTTITIDANNSSLDTSGIPDEILDSNGITTGPYAGKLKNVRVYKNGSGLTYQSIVDDFYGEKPASILYINGGVQIGDPNLYALLREAASNESGIMALGDASAKEALLIDTSKQAFPVMGVQRDFRFKAFYGDEVKEFDFDTLNNETLWKISDTVVLAGFVNYSNENQSSYYMLVKGKGTDKAKYAFYNNAGVLDTAEVEGKLIYSKVGATITNNINVPGVEVLTKYGEWSIKATAVDIIDDDLYAPEMTSGIYNNHDAILVGKSDGVYVAKANWGAPFKANNTVIAARGNKVDGVVGNWVTSSDGNYFNVTSDFVFTCPNIEDGSVNDEILVIKAGTQIYGATVDTDNDLQGGSYLDTYLAGGYKNLKINFTNINEQIFKEVFPNLDTLGIKELKFKPWTVKGRIQADADIWAFNEQLKLESFSPLYEGLIPFHPDTFYVDYLGDQVAGEAGYKQFVKPPEKDTDFNLPADSMRIDSAGYGDKAYHVIGAVQKNHRRLVMLGFQPTYLENTKLTQLLLQDATKWISVDDFKIEKPDIYPEDGANIHTTFDTMHCAVDFTQKGDGIKKAEYNLTIELTYAGVTKTKVINIPADDGKTDIDSFVVTFSDLGINIDPTDLNNTTVSFKIKAEAPNPAQSSFEGDSTLGTFNIYKLTNPNSVYGNIGSSEEYEGTSFIDTFYTDTATAGSGKYFVDSVVTIHATIDGAAEVNGASKFGIEILPDQSTVTAWATAPGYINSGTVTKEYIQTAQEFGLKSAKYLETDAIADGMPDVIEVELTNLTKQVIGENASVSVQDVLDSVLAYIDLPDGITVDASQTATHADSILTIYIVTDPSLYPKTDVDPATDSLKTTKDVLINGVGDMKKQAIKIKDGMAPIVTKVSVDPLNLTLTVDFSEGVKISEAKDGFLEFVKIDGLTYTVELDESSGSSLISGGDGSETFTFKIKGFVDSTGTSVTPITGDSVSISVTGGIKDGSGANEQTKENKKIAITVSAYPLNILSAYYYDIGDTLDGYVDEIKVFLDSLSLALINGDSTINNGTVATALTPYMNNQLNLITVTDKDLTIDSITQYSDGDLFTKGVVLHVHDSKVNKPNTTSAGDSLALDTTAAVGTVGVLQEKTVPIGDSLAPVLITVIFDPKDKEGGKDTLTVIFSEVVDKPDNLEDFLIFTDGKITYKMELTLVSDPNNTNTFIYEVISVVGKTYPEDLDSVSLLTGSGITDKTGNVQDKTTEPITITVGDYNNDISVGVIGPFDPNDPIDPILIEQIDPNGMTTIGSNSVGTVVLVSITGAILPGDVVRGELWVYDAVGNEVATGIPGEPTITSKGEFKLAAVWDGTNDAGRVVGSFNYVSFMKIYKKTAGESQEQLLGIEKFMIGVSEK